MTLKPLYDRLVVRRLEAETITESGIIIPDKSAEKPTQGEVIAVGDGVITNAGELCVLQVKKNDRILFGQYAGTSVKIDGEDLLILKEADVLAIVELDQSEEK
jgi:chaperonin GroES